MKDKRKPNFNKLAAILCVALVAVLIGGFCIGSTVAPKNCVKTGKATLWSYAIYKIEGSDAVASMDMFVGDYRTYDENGDARVEVHFYTTESAAQNGGSYVGDAINIKFNADNPGDLYTSKRVFEGKKYTSRYMKVDFYHDIDAYEMAVFNADGKRLKLTLIGVRPTDSNYSTSAKALAKYKNLTDEQSKMPYTHSKYTALTKYETKMLSAAESLLHGDGLTVSDTAMPLGVFAVSLGVLIFGANAFGARIISYLFMLATLILLYFMGKKYFGKRRGGLILSLLYLSSSVVLSAGTLMSVSNITALLLLLEFMYLCKYLFEGGDEKTLYLSGLFFGLAINVQFVAVFTLLGVAALFAYAKYKKTKLTLYKCAVAYIGMPLILIFITSLLSIFFGYADYFKTANPVLIFIKSIGLTLAAKTGESGIGGLIGLNALDLNGNGKYFAFVNPVYALFTLASAVAMVIVVVIKLVQKKKGTGVGLDENSLKSNIILWSATLPLIIGFAIFAKSLTVVDLPIILVFWTWFGAKALNLGYNSDSTITVKANSILWSVFLTAIFCVGFVGVAGYAIPNSVAGYLYKWFIF